jgi:glycosyltransferase involved in cell wall biosynthesis
MIENGRKFGPGEPAIGVGAITDMARIRGKKRIGFVFWETSILPLSYVRLLQQHLHEIWTPTRWGKDVLVASGIPERLMRIVPSGVDEALFTPAPGENQHETFRFLSVGRWQVRKGSDDLVIAFCREFRPDEPVEFVLRCFTKDGEPSPAQRIARLAPSAHPRITVVERCGSDALAALYKSCDAFVLPTKGEGWGLPVLEAMASALPVIVTKYSAPAELLNDSIAYRIRVQSMVPAFDPVWFPQRRAYGVWAQPDVEHLQSLMRHVYEHRDEARDVGLRAREAVCTGLTWDHAAATACRILDG